MQICRHTKSKPQFNTHHHSCMLVEKQPTTRRQKNCQRSLRQSTRINHKHALRSEKGIPNHPFRRRQPLSHTSVVLLTSSALHQAQPRQESATFRFCSPYSFPPPPPPSLFFSFLKYKCQLPANSLPPWTTTLQAADGNRRHHMASPPTWLIFSTPAPFHPPTTTKAPARSTLH